MPQAPHDQQDWIEPAATVLDRLVLCTRRLPTDAALPEAEREAANVLRMTLANACLSMAVVVVGVVSAALDIVAPVNIGVGGSVILILAYLQQSCASAELGVKLAVIPALRSRRLRILRLAEEMIDTVAIALLYVAGSSLIVWSMAELL